jgi:creatinine amidohydrolase
MVGPLLNIGITNEAGDQSHDGTYIYPGSLTVGTLTFVGLYVDLMRSLHDSGVNTIVLYSGHLGGRHLEAIVMAAQEASRTIPGLRAYAVIDSERLERLKITRDNHILVLDNGLNFPMLADLLSEGAKPDFTTHADGWETSLLLHFRPEVVRPGYAELPHAPSSGFIQAIMSGDRGKNPSGMGGFPTDKASAETGRRIAAYRTELIGKAILASAVASK